MRQLENRGCNVEGRVVVLVRQSCGSSTALTAVASMVCAAVLVMEGGHATEEAVQLGGDAGAFELQVGATLQDATHLLLALQCLGQQLPLPSTNTAHNAGWPRGAPKTCLPSRESERALR